MKIPIYDIVKAFFSVHTPIQVLLIRNLCMHMHVHVTISYVYLSMNTSVTYMQMSEFPLGLLVYRNSSIFHLFLETIQLFS